MKWIFLFALCSCGGFSQDRFERGVGELTGLVVDASGKPVSARVARMGAVGSTVGTDSEGRFLIADVPVGKVRLAAFDSQGNFAGLDTIAIGAMRRDVGTLTVSAADLSEFFLLELGFERRLTSGPRVEEAHVSRTGQTVLWKTEEGLWFSALTEGEPFHPRLLSLPAGRVVGIDDSFIWGFDSRTLWRMRFEAEDVEHHVLVDSSHPAHCVGVSARGLVCAEVVSADMFLELTMPGRLFLWSGEAANPTLLVDPLPDGLGRIALAPNGDSLVFAIRPFGQPRSGRAVFLSLSDGNQTSHDGNSIFALAFAPTGACAVARLSSTGHATLHVDGVSQVLGDNVKDIARVGYDAALNRWATLVSRGPGIQTWLGVPASGPQALDWKTDGTRVAFERAERHFTQLWIRKGDQTQAVTSLAADHRLLGMRPHDGGLLFLARDPRTGLEQLFVARTP